MPEPDLFSDQAQERPDAKSRTGRKIVYEDDPDDEEIPTLPDGRFDGEGEWSRQALSGVPANERTHKQSALLMLYRQGRITEFDFIEAHHSTKLRARIADLRRIDDAPPICTDEDRDPTEYYTPQADTEP